MTTETTPTAGADTAVVETPATTTTDTSAAASAPATTETKAAADTLLTGETKDVVTATPTDWPADWREKLAGEDKKYLEQLKRYGSPLDWAKKGKELEGKLSSGEYKRDVPKPEDVEQLKAWRAERGIPAEATDYKIELPNGVVIGEADKPLIESFTAQMHGKDWDNAKVNEALSWYYAEQDRMLAARAEADQKAHIDGQVELKSEWGQEFTPNINAVKNLIAGMPEGVAERFLAGRLSDGRKIGDDPGMIRWLANLSRELNPAATLLPSVSGDVGKGLNDRIADLEKMMGDYGSDYWRGSKSESLQQEYRDLVDARTRMAQRSAAA